MDGSQLIRILTYVLDILCVAVLIYFIIKLIQGTRALAMLMGLFVAIAIFGLSSTLDLYTLNWVLSYFLSSLLLIIVVVFQHDIRRVLARVGRAPLKSFFSSAQESRSIEEIVKACTSLANRKIGGLIIIQREANVMEYLDVGVLLESLISRELLISIFLPSSPIHDGAVVIQHDRILAAGCFLPMILSTRFGNEYGTRHRAAIGITDETDALVIVISEEKGWISLAANGGIENGINGAELKDRLINYLGTVPTSTSGGLS